MDYFDLHVFLIGGFVFFCSFIYLVIFGISRRFKKKTFFKIAASGVVLALTGILLRMPMDQIRLSQTNTFEHYDNEGDNGDSTFRTTDTDTTNDETNIDVEDDDAEEVTTEGEPKIDSVSEDNKDTIISFTQLDCEDRGYELTYQGEDLWNVSINFIDGKNKWIVTTGDKNYGRVKAIYEWDGEENSGALLVYLLVSGEELLNNL